MLLSMCSKPIPERGFADSDLASHVGDRATGVDDQASGFFTEFWTELAILSRHDDFSFPEWNLFGPQSGRWEARQSSKVPPFGRCWVVVVMGRCRVVVVV